MKEYIKREDAIKVLDCHWFEPEPKIISLTLLAAKKQIIKVPTADVVPRAEYNELLYKLEGVMHSVDKWLDGDELNQDEVNRAATMREKTLQIVENARTEVASEIIGDVANAIWEGEPDSLNVSVGKRYYNKKEFIAELRKKYTEGGEQE